MNPFRKFLSLTIADKALLLRAWLVVAMIQLGLWTISFKRLHGFVSRQRSHGHRRRRLRSDPVRIAWAVTIASRYVPRADVCLPRALATYYLLRRNGYDGHFRLGVACDEQDGFKAHAWVECDGKPIVGDGNLEQFNCLEVPDPNRSAKDSSASDHDDSSQTLAKSRPNAAES